MTTQKKDILSYLFRYGSITRMEAFSKLGICELSSRIGELEKDGHRFIREWYKGVAENGRKWKVVRYRLARNVRPDLPAARTGSASTEDTSGSVLFV